MNFKMVENNLIFLYDAKLLSIKDPFSLNFLKSLETEDKLSYYTGIISGFIEGILNNHPGMKKPLIQPLLPTRYYLQNYPTPVATHYASLFEDSKNTKKGQNKVIVNGNQELSRKLQNLSNILRKIEISKLEEIIKPVESNAPHFSCMGDIINFYYYKPDNESPYFLFKINLPEEKNRIFRRLIN